MLCPFDVAVVVDVVAAGVPVSNDLCVVTTEINAKTFQYINV